MVNDHGEGGGLKDSFSYTPNPDDPYGTKKRSKYIESLETFSSKRASYNVSLQNARKLHKKLEEYVVVEGGERLLELNPESQRLHAGTFSPHHARGEFYPYCNTLSVPIRVSHEHRKETDLYYFNLATLVLDITEDSDGFRFVIKAGSELIYDPAKLYELGEKYGIRIK